MTSIKLERLSKRFGATVAVDDVSLTIESGELFFLLGPSGCGKTTLLRMIAGFIEPSSGRVLFDDRDVTNVPPNKRNTGMVFQSYALWPHMTVAQNVAYGLGVRKVAAEERNERVGTALKAVRMEAFGSRKPNELSGGQQQRVALARALVIKPLVLLLDEPLSNLDAKLRLEMRVEIRRICKEAEITTVYVTHDQGEALSMADRVALMRDGHDAQAASPRELYDRPNSRFVADFLGETNFLSATVRGTNDHGVELDTPVGCLTSAAGVESSPKGGNVTCSIRPEAFSIGAASNDVNTLRGRRVHSMYLGHSAQHLVELAEGVTVKVLELNPTAADSTTTDGEMYLHVSPDQVVILSD